MNIIFLGDIVARPGREAVGKIINDLKVKYSSDLIIANVENVAHGKGVTIKTLDELKKYGIDFFTSGNHVWKKEGKIALEKKEIPLIRPANYPKEVSIGDGYRIIKTLGKRLLVINLIGRTFFRNHYDCPFKKSDEILDKFKFDNLDGILVDFHCEATSEIKALGYYLDGRVSAVIGTHTHVLTADASILPKKTAYISGSGMCGIKHSVLGKDKDEVIEMFLKQDAVDSNWYNEWNEGSVNGVFIKIKNSKSSTKIESIDETVLNG
jgi:2',3'-cyclic-nucleotide 2'-phosphodiesterase